MDADLIELGIIGAGTVAEYGHLPALANIPGVKVRAIADQNLERARKLAQDYHIEHVLQSYEELLAIPSLDVVIVATPVETHYPIVMTASSAQKHVLCEKPIAQTPKEGREMARVMEERGLVLAINFLLRFSEPLHTMKKWVEQGKIGEIQVLRLIFNSPGPGWRSRGRLQGLMTEGGGPIFDCGVHYFDLARWFTQSEFCELKAQGVNLQKFQNPDHVLCIGKLESGAICLIEESWIYTLGAQETRRYRAYELIGERGTVSYNTDSEELALLTGEETIKLKIPAEDKGFDEIYRLFFAAIRNGESEGLPSGQEGVRAIEAALTALADLQKQDSWGQAANN